MNNAKRYIKKKLILLQLSIHLASKATAAGHEVVDAGANAGDAIEEIPRCGNATTYRHCSRYIDKYIDVVENLFLVVRHLHHLRTIKHLFTYNIYFYLY